LAAALDHWYNFDDESGQPRTFHAPIEGLIPSMVADAIFAALPQPAPADGAPRTAAGRALLTDAAIPAWWAITPEDDPVRELRTGILAIEAEAAQPAPGLRDFASSVAETSNDPHLVREAERILGQTYYDKSNRNIAAALASEGLREAHPLHNHESNRIPPTRAVQDACPGCIAAGAIRRHDDHLPSDDPAVEAVASALTSSGAEWHGDHRCTGCAMTLRNRLREYGYDALIEAEAAQPAPGLDVERTSDDRDETIERLTTALKVATHAPHDRNGPMDEASGFPTCAGCGGIITHSERFGWTPVAEPMP
jgi:hypothetical protein